jgi:hypothetical protein
MKVKLLLLCLMAISFLAGCKLSKDDKETIVKVTPEFTIDLFEQLGDQRVFQFKVATIEKQECTNYTISTYSALTFKKVSLNVNDLVPPVDCISGEAPATTISSVGTLPLGFFNLNINLKNTVKNDGLLKVYQDSIVVDLNSSDGLEMRHKVLCRIPETAIWGYTGFSNKDTGAGVAASFLSDLTEMTERVDFPQGYYGYYKLDENGNLILSPSPDFTYFHTFLFDYQGDISALEDLLDSYRTGSGGADVEFVLFTGTGKSL